MGYPVVVGPVHRSDRLGRLDARRSGCERVHGQGFSRPFRRRSGRARVRGRGRHRLGRASVASERMMEGAQPSDERHLRRSGAGGAYGRVRDRLSGITRAWTHLPLLAKRSPFWARFSAWRSRSWRGTPTSWRHVLCGTPSCCRSATWHGRSVGHCGVPGARMRHEGRALPPCDDCLGRCGYCRFRAGRRVPRCSQERFPRRLCLRWYAWLAPVLRLSCAGFAAARGAGGGVGALLRDGACVRCRRVGGVPLRHVDDLRSRRRLSGDGSVGA